MTPLLLALALAATPDAQPQSNLVLEAYGTFTASTGLGEDTISPSGGIRIGHQKFYANLFYERSRKIETGKGYIVGVDLEHHRGVLLTGASAHMRDGGAWRKYPIQLAMGVQLGGLALYVTQETITLGDDGPGSERTRSLTARYRSKWYETKTALYWYKTHNSEGVGATFSTSLRFGKRAR